MTVQCIHIQQAQSRKHQLKCVGYLPHDASEDVHEDGLDLLVGVQQLEGLLHLALGGSTAHVQEVGGITAFQLLVTKTVTTTMSNRSIEYKNTSRYGKHTREK